ncbi:hypothetical protein PVMG_05616, partial [Plasmodium vivax Mauritania I]
LYKYINAKNDSIKHCVDKRYINSDFSKDEKINKFRSICNKRGKCHINVESNINTHPALKRTSTVQSCRGRTNCKTEKTETKETAGKAKLRQQLDVEPSKTTRLQRPKAQETSREHSGGEESNKQSEDLPAQSDLNTRLNSIKSKDDEPASVTDKQYSTSVQGSISTQALSDIGDTQPLELNLQAEDSPSQSTPAGESDARSILRVRYSGESLPQSNLSVDQPLDANPRNTQRRQGGGVENQDHSHENLVTQLTDSVSPPLSLSSSEKLDNKGSIARDNNIPGNNVVAHVLETASHIYTEEENVDSASTEGVSSGDEGVRAVANGKEIKNYQEPGREHLCEGNSCNAEQVDEVTDGSLDIYGKVVNTIKNNPQIIKTSAPIGIALLLGLLFKYTPLWRVLTKKNRKKGAGINEELNSVLQEPSIMDDERSIPFSYGAFEYSTFDQNSY